MRKTWTASLLLIAFAAEAGAQSTNCMRMAGGMVNCNTIGGGSTTCMPMGTTMVSCNTIGGGSQNNAAGGSFDTPSGNYDDGGSGEALGRGVADFINGFGERAFRRKVGAMLANGDCQGASRFAYEKGRIEVGNLIAQSCQTNRAALSQEAQVVTVPSVEVANKKAARARVEPPRPLTTRTQLSRGVHCVTCR
jgi:hypothetical protein